MIASLEGVVGSVAQDSVVLEIGGIGYRVFCGAGTLAKAREGTTLKLHTHHLVREDAQALYAGQNSEYAVTPGVEPSELIKSWGTLHPDALALAKIADLRKKASELVDKVKFDAGSSS